MNLFASFCGPVPSFKDFVYQSNHYLTCNNVNYNNDMMCLILEAAAAFLCASFDPAYSVVYNKF